MSKPGQAINLPPRVQSGQPITAAQFNAIRESIARLARSGVPDGPKVYPRRYDHPFKITTDGEFLRVGFGSIAAQRLLNSHPIYQELRCYFNKTTPTYLVGDPWNTSATVGEFELVDDTEYGVWLEIDRGPEESQAGFGGDDYDGLSTLPLGPAAQVFVSSTHLGPGYWTGGGTIPTFSDDLLYRFIGRVSVDENGNAEIIQHLRSDITLSALVYPYGINFPAEPPP